MFLLLAMVIIGGRRSLAGCVIGAIVLTVVQQELINLAAYAQLGYGLVVVLVVVFAPTGLVGIPGTVRPAGTGGGGGHPGEARCSSRSGRCRRAGGLRDPGEAAPGGVRAWSSGSAG